MRPLGPGLRLRRARSFPLMVLPCLLAGALLGACGLPLPWSALTPLPLAALLWLAATGETPGNVAGRLFWGMSAYFAVQLWWLTHFMVQLSGLAWGGVLVLPLFLIEGAFWALMAWLLTRPFQDVLARIWALAGGWVLLEWLRTLGPLAFPWGDLGYTLLPTPLSQTADLWGALGLSVLVAAAAASTVSAAYRRWRMPLLSVLLWAGGWVYGSTRTHAAGPTGGALVIRSDFDSFGRASGRLSGDAQFQRLLTLSQGRHTGEITVWSESAIFREADLRRAPAPGLYGVYTDTRANTAQSWDGQAPGTVVYTKLKPVPFGEFFPLSDVARPLYDLIFRQLGFAFEPPPAGNSTLPLRLGGTLYGAYICYDSIFSWVTRALVQNGAQLLVNVSNDGWYTGWGVRQHFQMGRLRAIESRRWVIRSVNRGVAAVVDDLGVPVQTLSGGEGVLHARYRLLGGQTVYLRVGDVPALLGALGLLALAWREGRRSRHRARL